MSKTSKCFFFNFPAERDFFNKATSTNVSQLLAVNHGSFFWMEDAKPEQLYFASDKDVSLGLDTGFFNLFWGFIEMSDKCVAL